MRGIGATKADAFEQAALALTGVVTDPRKVAAREAIDVRCEAPDDELLLVEWLNALVLEMAVRKMVFARFVVAIEGNTLVGTAYGENIDAMKHQPAVEVKGATLTSLRVAHERDRWIAQTVVDV